MLTTGHDGLLSKPNKGFWHSYPLYGTTPAQDARNAKVQYYLQKFFDILPNPFADYCKPTKDI